MQNGKRTIIFTLLSLLLLLLSFPVAVFADETGVKVFIEQRGNDDGSKGSVTYQIGENESVNVGKEAEALLANGDTVVLTVTPAEGYELDAMSGLFENGYMGDNDHRLGNFDSDGKLSIAADSYSEGTELAVQVEFKSAGGGSNPGGEPDPPGPGTPSMNYSFTFNGPSVVPNIRIYSVGNSEGVVLTKENSSSGSFGDKLNNIGVTSNGDKFYVSIEVEDNLETGETARYSSIKINGVERTIEKSFGRNTYEVEYQEGGTLTIEVTATATIVKNIMWANEGANVAGTDFDNPEVKLVNGSAYVYKVYNNGTDMIDITSTIEGTDTGCVDENGRGYIVLEAGNIAEFEFIPKYGHQLVEIMANGTPDDNRDAVDIGAQERINTYRFVMPGANVHFYAEFAEQGDIVKSSVDEIAGKDSSINLQAGELDAGSAQLLIDDSNASESAKSAMAAKAKEAGFDQTYAEMSIDLNQVFYKGMNNADDVWTNEHNSLNKPATVTLSLSDFDSDEPVCVVHEKHDGSIEVIDASINGKGELSFETSGFSNYSIVKKAKHVHKGILVNAKSETCTANGNIKHYKCECGKLFKDAACKTELSKKDVVIKAAHKPTKVIKTATLKTNGSVTVVCDRCKKTLSKSKTVYAANDISLKNKTLVYTGDVQKTKVVVKDSKKNVLTKGVDYRVDYIGDCRKVGTYEVKITGIGNYKYTKTLKYTICPKKPKFDKLSISKGKIKVQWTPQKQLYDGYQIQYSTDKSFAKKNTKTINLTKGTDKSATISGITAKKTYYVRIRSYKMSGKVKVYSEWTGAKSIKVK